MLSLWFDLNIAFEQAAPREVHTSIWTLEHNFLRLSDQPEYLIAIPAAIGKDFATARANLKILIERAEKEGDKVSHTYLLQVLGNVEAESGDSVTGHLYHQKAISLGPAIPLTYIHYAKGLLRSFHRPDLAVTQLAAAETLLDSRRWIENGADMTRVWYVREIHEVRAEIRNTL